LRDVVSGEGLVYLELAGQRLRILRCKYSHDPGTFTYLKIQKLNISRFKKKHAQCGKLLSTKILAHTAMMEKN
jgi:hypothetical protein